MKQEENQVFFCSLLMLIPPEIPLILLIIIKTIILLIIVTLKSTLITRVNNLETAPTNMYKRCYINLGRITQNSQILITYVSHKSIARVSPKVSQVALCPTREIYDVLGYYKKLVVGSA